MNTLASRLAQRTLVRWRAPKECEPAHGMMLALPALHHQQSAAAFARDIGIDNILDVQACLHALCSSRLAKPEHVTSLRRWTPVISGNSVTINGQTVGRDDWSARTRRFCPACLHEDPYHRVWFDFTFVHECPFHGLPLTDRHPDGTTNLWATASVASTANGVSLAKASPRLASPPRTLETYALGRLGLIAADPNPLLQSVDLREIIEAAELLGRLAIGGWTLDVPMLGRLGISSRDAHRAGFAVLNEGEDGIRALFRDVAMQAPATVYGAKTLFGWAASIMPARLDLAARCYRIGSKVAIQLGRHARRHTRGDDPEREFLTFAEVAQLISERVEISANVVQHLAEMFELVQPHKGGTGAPYLVARFDVDMIEGIVSNSLNRTDAAKYLAVPHETFTQIVRYNHIPKIGTRWGYDGPGGGLEDRYNRIELDKFLDCIPIPIYGHIYKGDAMKFGRFLPTVPEVLDATGYDAGEFFNEVFAGRIKLEGRDHNDPGLCGFRIDTANQGLNHPFFKRCFSTITRRGHRSGTGITQRELCARMKIEAPTAKILVDAGLIPLAEGMEQNSRLKLDRSAVEQFIIQYAPAKIYAKHLGTNSQGVKSHLERLGVFDLLKTKLCDRDLGDLYGKLSPIYDRSAVRKALGLTEDPDSNVTDMCWDRLATHLGKNHSCFGVRFRWGETARVQTANNAWRIDVRYDFTPFSVRDDEFYRDPFRYRISAKLCVDSVQGRKRAAGLAANARARIIHPRITWQYDEKANTFEAELTSSIVSFPRGNGNGMEWIYRYGHGDPLLIEKMVHTLKASFEDSDAGRKYDHRLIGHWASHEVHRTSSLEHS